jgi:hypothetical protein
MDGAKAVKRHNAQYDVFNRLHSIAADQAFVERVSKEWFEGRFEVVRKASVLQVEWELTNSKSEMWNLVHSS